MDEISVKALAKINLGLDVVRRREDGYHELRMVMQTVHLYDRLEMKKAASADVALSANLSYLPTNEGNLAVRAVQLLREEFHIVDGVEMHLQKRIPVAAGMAGGSTDAAAALYGMNKLFDLGLSRKELMERGVTLGADVPYCLLRGTALAEGIGEKLKQLPPMVKCPVLIARPPISVSTKAVYGALRLDEATRHPDIDRLVEDVRLANKRDGRDLYADGQKIGETGEFAAQRKSADEARPIGDGNIAGEGNQAGNEKIANSNALARISSDMGNLLEDVTIPQYPVIAEIKDFMLNKGAVGALMSGSGPTVFGLFDNDDTAEEAYEALRGGSLARQVYLTTIYNTTR